jgi:hypothetical protein
MTSDSQAVVGEFAALVEQQFVYYTVLLNVIVYPRCRFQDSRMGINVGSIKATFIASSFERRWSNS